MISSMLSAMKDCICWMRDAIMSKALEPALAAYRVDTGWPKEHLNANMVCNASVGLGALAIAGDTGPLHLACALRRPVVGIYGPTDPSRNGPYGCNFKVLRSPTSRRDHTRHPEPEAGLLTIHPADVLPAVHGLLAEENAR